MKQAGEIELGFGLAKSPILFAFPKGFLIHLSTSIHKHRDVSYEQRSFLLLTQYLVLRQ